MTAKPHFIEPSLTAGSSIRCTTDQHCHVTLHASPGIGNDKECSQVEFTKLSFERKHLFSSCDTCTPGDDKNNNCTIDLSMIPATGDVGKWSMVCIQVSLTENSIAHQGGKGGSGSFWYSSTYEDRTRGEERCFNVTVQTLSSYQDRGNCQYLHCENRGFCGHSKTGTAVCHCPVGITGSVCETGLHSSSHAPKQVFTESTKTLDTMWCRVNQTCVIPYQVVTPANSKPHVIPGYTDPMLIVDKPTLTGVQVSNSSSEYQGHLNIKAVTPGSHVICLQTVDKGVVQDEACLTAETIDVPPKQVNTFMPYFVEPTLPPKSTFICQINTACNLLLYFTKADMFGSSLHCPSIALTHAVEDVYIFPATKGSANCVSQLSYMPSSISPGFSQPICVQVSLPGKRGEERCFNAELKLNTSEHASPGCVGHICYNAGRCIANPASNPSTPTCKCTPQFSGTDCSSAICHSDADCSNGATCDVQHSVCQGGTGSMGQVLKLEDAIHLGCDTFNWNITVDMHLLNMLYPQASRDNLFLGDNSCRGTEKGSLLVFQQRLKDCLSNERTSGDNYIYENDIFYAILDPLRPFIIRQHKWTFNVECDVKRSIATSTHVHYDVDAHHASVSGNYHVNISFFRDPNYLQPILGMPIHAGVGDDVYVKVFLADADWTIKMRVHSCYTVPSDNAPERLKYYMLQDGCEMDTNTHIISQSSHETRFVFQVFEYMSNHEGFDVHCSANFCETKDYSPQCVQRCIGSPAIVG